MKFPLPLSSFPHACFTYSLTADRVDAGDEDEDEYDDTGVFAYDEDDSGVRYASKTQRKELWVSYSSCLIHFLCEHRGSLSCPGVSLIYPAHYNREGEAVDS